MTAMMTTILLKHMHRLYFKLVTQCKCNFNLVCCKLIVLLELLNRNSSVQKYIFYVTILNHRTLNKKLWPVINLDNFLKVNYIIIIIKPTDNFDLVLHHHDY